MIRLGQELPLFLVDKGRQPVGKHCFHDFDVDVVIGVVDFGEDQLDGACEGCAGCEGCGCNLLN